MKKYFNVMLAAILICGACVMTSCTNSDNPVTQDEKKCVKYDVQFSFNTTKKTISFFKGKYAWWSGDEKHGPVGIYGTAVNVGYSSNEDVTFPAKESFFMHYAVKDDAVLEGDFELDNRGTYILTSYNASGKVLDIKSVDFGTLTGGVAAKDKMEVEADLAYVELNFTIADNGAITLEDLSFDETQSKSGIEW